ncbi:MAG: SpoIIIAH-like family protein [Oscillospiraceae bacterium]|nr:SpoIIIAH-like family protein [Oscillospiraceae bacterium]
MKMNVIVGKKQIVLSVLVLALGVAVYLNYQYSLVGENEFPISDAAAASASNETEENDNIAMDETYGEAYFAEAKLSRTRSRDEAVEALAAMLSKADLETEMKAELALEAAALAKSIETEGKIETLIKAKGFEECMVYYDTEKVDIIVKTAETGLSDEQVVQMQDVVLGEIDIPSENIRIVEVK